MHTMRVLSAQYALSTAHVDALVPALCEPHADVHLAGGARGAAAHSSAEASLPARRDALEAFVRLPHLHASGVSSHAPAFGADADMRAGVSRHFLENVCEVEVRGWVL